MNWMSGNHPMDQHGAQVNDMLNRMHRQPRPWANVNISMMQSMHIFVHEWDMKQPMDPIKVKTFPDWDQQKQRDKPYRMGRPGQHGRVAVCQSPKHYGFIACPNGHAAGQGPKHIIANLSTKRELLAVFHQWTGIIFEGLALLGKRVKIKMQPACNTCH